MSFPAMPPIGVPPTPPRPKAVDTAVKLTVTGTAIGAIGSLFTVLDDDFTASVLRQVDPTPEEAEMMAEVIPVAGVLGVLLTLGVFALLVVKIRAGRNWARALLTAFTAFSLITFLSAATQTYAELSLMWSLADVACCTAAVVYLFQKESAEFFRARMHGPRGPNSVSS